MKKDPSSLPGIPSDHTSLLSTLLGLRIERMTRYLYDNPESIPSIYGIPAHKVFSHFSAPLLLSLSDGRQLAIKVDTGLASIILKLLTADDLIDQSSVFNDNQHYPITSTDTQYSESKFENVIGNEITGVKLYKREAKNKRLESRPREAGLGLQLANDTEVIFSCGLHDGSDDFSVILFANLDLTLADGLHVQQIAGSGSL